MCDSFLILNLIYLLAFALTKEIACNGKKPLHNPIENDLKEGTKFNQFSKLCV